MPTVRNKQKTKEQDPDQDPYSYPYQDVTDPEQWFVVGWERICRGDAGIPELLSSIIVSKVNLLFLQLEVQIRSVSDPDPGSSALLTLGSAIRDENPESYFRKLRNNFLGLKYFNSLMQIRDPGWKKFGFGINIPDRNTENTADSLWFLNLFSTRRINEWSLPSVERCRTVVSVMS